MTIAQCQWNCLRVSSLPLSGWNASDAIGDGRSHLLLEIVVIALRCEHQHSQWTDLVEQVAPKEVLIWPTSNSSCAIVLMPSHGQTSSKGGVDYLACLGPYVTK